MQSDKVEIVEVTEGFMSTRAKETILLDSFIANLEGQLLHHPTPYTVQVGVGQHVDPVGPLKRTNHSCEPNAKLIFPSLHKNGSIQGGFYLVATRDIEKGEDIAFDYTTTEYEMSQGFRCLCGARCCLGEVKGFKFLTEEQKKKRKNDLSPVIRELYDNELIVEQLT